MPCLLRSFSCTVVKVKIVYGLAAQGSLKSFGALLKCPGILAVGRRYNACFMWVQYEVLCHAAALDKSAATPRVVVEKFIDVAWVSESL